MYFFTRSLSLFIRSDCLVPFELMLLFSDFLPDLLTERFFLCARFKFFFFTHLLRSVSPLMFACDWIEARPLVEPPCITLLLRRECDLDFDRESEWLYRDYCRFNGVMA